MVKSVFTVNVQFFHYVSTILSNKLALNKSRLTFTCPESGECLQNEIIYSVLGLGLPSTRVELGISGDLSVLIFYYAGMSYKFFTSFDYDLY